VSEHEEVPRRALCDGQWCSKSGVIVVNGRSTDVPVWVSADGTLVLPIGGDAKMKVEVDSRIRMLRQLWLVCDQGDLGRITGLRESAEGFPRSWLVTMDNGSECCVFEGEFEVVPEPEPGRPVSAASAMMRGGTFDVSSYF
jgi:hypothetical protein